ncbi:MAG: hypothetical protein JNL83_15545 [Myxococcales bacterium]|nr:hypothetical protein [Myxococcales bacterium]
MKASVLLVGALLGFAAEARADDGTWCAAGFAPGPDYGKKASATSTTQDACAGNPGNKRAWHFHGFVEKAGQCYACWDEESNTCETTSLRVGFRFLGSKDCGAVTIAKVGAKHHFDSQSPPPPPPPRPAPKAPPKPAK